MDNQDLEVLLENQSLKFEFTLRNLDLSQVFCPTPDDLERENRCLHHLLDWVQISILQQFQVETDRKFAEFKRDQNGQDILMDPWSFDFDDELPF